METTESGRVGEFSLYGDFGAELDNRDPTSAVELARVFCTWSRTGWYDYGVYLGPKDASEMIFVCLDSGGSVSNPSVQ